MLLHNDPPPLLRPKPAIDRGLLAARALRAAPPPRATCAAAARRFLLTEPQGTQWRATSLFCGAGGLDLGLLSEGVLTDAAYDKSLPALRMYDANLPARGRPADLSRFEPDDRCDVLTAGAPCQGFSTIGKRAVDDPRNGLLSRVADVALRIRPKVVLVENVPGARSGGHGVLWRALEDRMRLGDYNVCTMILSGEESGIAQRRRRLFMLCWRGLGETRLDIGGRGSPDLRAVLQGVEDVADHEVAWPTAGSTDALIARRIGAGQKLCNVRNSPNAIPTWDIPEVFGDTSCEEKAILRAVSVLRRRERRRRHGDGDPVERARLARHLGRCADYEVTALIDRGYLREMAGGLELRHTYNGKYRRLAWTDPSPTVDTHFGRMALFMHPDQDRGLSAREAARIQGFPDAYRLQGGVRDRFEAIGNAVPPPMASRLGHFIREALLKR